MVDRDRTVATFPAMTVPTTESPCIRVCHLDLDDACTGCRRTLDEIRRWSVMSSAERIAVNRRVAFESHERGDCSI